MTLINPIESCGQTVRWCASWQAGWVISKGLEKLNFDKFLFLEKIKPGRILNRDFRVFASLLEKGYLTDSPPNRGANLGCLISFSFD